MPNPCPNAGFALRLATQRRVVVSLDSHFPATPYNPRHPPPPLCEPRGGSSPLIRIPLIPGKRKGVLRRPSVLSPQTSFQDLHLVSETLVQVLVPAAVLVDQVSSVRALSSWPSIVVLDAVGEVRKKTTKRSRTNPHQSRSSHGSNHALPRLRLPHQRISLLRLPSPPRRSPRPRIRPQPVPLAEAPRPTQTTRRPPLRLLRSDHRPHRPPRPTPQRQPPHGHHHRLRHRLPTLQLTPRHTTMRQGGGPKAQGSSIPAPDASALDLPDVSRAENFPMRSGARARCFSSPCGTVH